MKVQFKKYLLILVPAIVISINLRAQTSYTLAPDPEFTVAGTSSLHDWTMTTATTDGNAIIVMENTTLKSIDELAVTFKAETLKSGKSGMDDNAYKALKTKKHPNITFKLTEVKSITKKGDHYLIEAQGRLTMAGESRTIDVSGQAKPVGNAINITGNKTFKMTDFNIDPPTALLGTVKTGDPVTINFNLTFKTK